MALDILLISAISADLECLFLGVKITILDRRNWLGIYIIKALECLKSWLKIEAFEEEDDVGEGQEEGHMDDTRQEGAI
jgi:hypothetical protein